MKIKIKKITNISELSGSGFDVFFNMNAKSEFGFILEIQDVPQNEYFISYLSESNILFRKNTTGLSIFFYSILHLEIFISQHKTNKLLCESDFIKSISQAIINYKLSGNFDYQFGNLKLKSKSVMGILNLTPDSFYDGGSYINEKKAFSKIDEYLELGVDIIDIGAESTRPGSEPVREEYEIRKLLPIIEYLQNKNVIISVDTYKSNVARESLKNGVHIINDISGLKFDNNMPEIVSEYEAGLIIMHINSTPKDMQINPFYANLINEIYNDLKNQISIAEAFGIKKIFVDPGIGFGKTVKDNFVLLNKIEEFKFLGYPVLIGTSRKSFIGKVLNQEPKERLVGTLITNIYSYLNGVSIFRVHDVDEFIQAKKIIELCLEPNLIN